MLGTITGSQLVLRIHKAFSQHQLMGEFPGFHVEQVGSILPPDLKTGDGISELPGRWPVRRNVKEDAGPNSGLKRTHRKRQSKGSATHSALP